MSENKKRRFYELTEDYNKNDPEFILDFLKQIDEIDDPDTAEDIHRDIESQIDGLADTIDLILHPIDTIFDKCDLKKFKTESSTEWKTNMKKVLLKIDKLEKFMTDFKSD
tara:strand:- start:139 stop:468 length:330 start_codon:yes stop_codon:yes gene_type:complete